MKEKLASLNVQVTTEEPYQRWSGRVDPNLRRWFFLTFKKKVIFKRVGFSSTGTDTGQLKPGDLFYKKRPQSPIED